MITWSARGLGWEQFPPHQKWFAMGETLAHTLYLSAFNQSEMHITLTRGLAAGLRHQSNLTNIIRHIFLSDSSAWCQVFLPHCRGPPLLNSDRPQISQYRAAIHNDTLGKRWRRGTLYLSAFNQSEMHIASTQLVYGDLTGVVTAEETLTETVVVAANVNSPSGVTNIFSNDVIVDPPTMAKLTNGTLLSAGTHKMKIEIIIIRDDDNKLADCFT